MAAVQVVALEDMLGEEAELAGGAAALTVQTGLWQAGFLGADLGDLRAAGLDLIGDGVQERGAVGARGLAIALERRLCRDAGAVDQLGGADGIGMGRAMRRVRGKGRRAGNPFACDQVLAVRGVGVGHGRSLCRRAVVVWPFVVWPGVVGLFVVWSGLT